MALLGPNCRNATFGEEGSVHGDIGTVIEVTWQPVGRGEAWVEYGPDDSYDFTTPAVPDGEGTSHTVLLGNKPLQDVHWRVVARSEGRTRVGADHVTETVGIPAALPDYTLLDDDGSFEGWVLGVSWAAESYLYIIDSDADVVWYKALPLAKVTLALDPVHGQSALRYLQVSQDHSLDASVVSTIGLDGQDQGSVAVERGHHSFVAHDDGSLAWLALDVREHKDQGSLVGDKVMLWDASTDEVTELYSTWDHLDYDPDETLEATFYPQGTDWTHTNGLHYAPERGTYWLTMGGVNRLVEIDAVTGEPLTTVGEGGYDLEPDLEHWGDGYGPHGATWTPDDTLLVFDNAYDDDIAASRVLEYTLDDIAEVAGQVWQLDGEDGWLAMVLGGAERLDSGETFVHWGNLGLLQLLDANGEQTWLARQSSIIGDAVPLNDLYGRE